MKQKAVLLLFSLLVVLGVLIVADAQQTTKSEFQTASEHANYSVEVSPAEPQSDEQIAVTIEVKNTEEEPLDVVLFTTPGLDRTAASVPPGGSDTVNHTVPVEVAEPTTYTVGVVGFEDSNTIFNRGFDVQAQPAIPPRTPLYVSAATMAVLALYASTIILVDLLGVEIWVHEEPMRYLVGVAIGSFTAVIGIDWIWNVFGFLNDSSLVVPFVFIASLVCVACYLLLFVDPEGYRPEAPG